MFLIFGTLAAVIIHAQKPDSKATDEKAIRANVEQMSNGWNAKSGEQFAKPFAENADYVVINGMQLKSRGVIAKAHQGIFDGEYKKSVLSLAVENIRFARPDVAIVHVYSKLNLTPEETSSGGAKITLVMIKTNGKWEIEAFQNTQIQANGGK